MPLLKKIFSLGFCFSTLFISQATPPNRQIKGIYDGVENARKHLSPLHGWLLFKNGCIENIYLNGPKNDHTTKLVHLLFYKLPVEPFSFGATSSVGSIATYLTPKDIGKILNITENTSFPKKINETLTKIITDSVMAGLTKKAIEAQKILYSSTIEFIKKEFEKLDEIRKGTLTDESVIKWVGQENKMDSDQAYFDWANQLITSIQKDFQIYSQEQNKIDNKIEKKVLDLIKEKMPNNINAANTLTKAYNNIKEKKDIIKFVTKADQKNPTNFINLYKDSLQSQDESAIKKVKSSKHIKDFVETLIGAYKEAGQLGDNEMKNENKPYQKFSQDIPTFLLPTFLNEDKPYQKYPQYTPTFLLQAFLVARIEKKDELKGYFESFQPSILKQDAEKNMWTESFEVGKEPYLLDISIDKSDVKNNYEDVCFAIINWENVCSPFPPFFNYFNDMLPTGIDLDPRPADCVEITIFNFARIIFAILGYMNDPDKTYNVLIMNIFNDMPKLSTKLNMPKKEFSDQAENFLNFLWMNMKTIDEDSRELHQHWFDFVSSLKQVKYLTCFDIKGKESIKNEKQDCPFILLDADEKMKHGTHNHKALLPSDFITYELAGYPSAFVEIINHLFNLEFKNFKELCDTFSIKSQTDLSTITDDLIYSKKDSNTALTNVDFQCTINKTKAFFRLTFSVGHAGIESLTQKAIVDWKDIDYVKDHLDKYHLRNIAYALTNFSEKLPSSIFTSKDLAYSTYLFYDFSNKTKKSNSVLSLMDKLDKNNTFFAPLFQRILDIDKTQLLKTMLEQVEKGKIDTKQLVFVLNKINTNLDEKERIDAVSTLAAFFLEKGDFDLKNLSSTYSDHVNIILSILNENIKKIKKEDFVCLFIKLFNYSWDESWTNPISKKIITHFIEIVEKDSTLFIDCLIKKYDRWWDNNNLEYTIFQMFKWADKAQKDSMKNAIITYLENNENKLDLGFFSRFFYRCKDETALSYSYLYPTISTLILKQKDLVEYICFERTNVDLILNDENNFSKELKEAVRKISEKKKQ